VPVGVRGKTIGVLTVDRLFAPDVDFEEDIRLLKTVASIVGQAVKLHEMVEAEKAAVPEPVEMAATTEEVASADVAAVTDEPAPAETVVKAKASKKSEAAEQPAITEEPATSETPAKPRASKKKVGEEPETPAE
jgi:transcriptional regulator with GAF, ATPase, and Fis domain